MGSTTTVLLSFARLISVSFLMVLGVSYLTGMTLSLMMVTLVFSSFFFIPWGEALPDGFDVTNPYNSVRLNPYLEVALPLILGYFVYNGADVDGRVGLLRLGLLYLIGAGWLLSSTGDFDLRARKNTFGF